MKYFPVHLDMRHRTVIVIGGGPVAERKCFSLVEAGASVLVISPETAPGMQKLVSEGCIDLLPREYRDGDLSDALLVFAATDRVEVNLAVASEAGKRGIPVNIADCPERSTFVSPAVVSRGDLLITVSTGGKSPALARKIREDLEGRFGREYDLALQLLGSVREKLLTEKRGSQYNKKLLVALVSHDVPELFKSKSYYHLDLLLREIFGPEYTLQNLGADTGMESCGSADGTEE
jgi:precorrin-2 dehydrogenase / sirohydrochlorin ferrochelatase